MKPALPPITEAEAEVMEVLWRSSPLSAEDIAAALAERQDWQLATVKTLLNRLLKKDALVAERDGRRFLYAPRFPRAEWAHNESLSLLDRLFGGSLAPLVSHFSSQRKLKASDVKALKQLIEDYETRGGKGDRRND
ncbi:BlaI/MecI/CopY family transcriptional regulator [Roseateles chitosanitabidus]|jgi:predicted transcriptional regulator|uniref:BlaI/MecI/CopY family transcriptional regulator n=1 Tax=Roseateles chitosanitabidus TaxID=65048 RepID=UPI000829BAEC|nr:BlaI/MecI/CopY family transcriptional regulator [Roseateles chitosanitabidus]MBO9687467.1 BlaI/MecI/CopY family transcriptional regulator [Roseateles chitosanitabidus]